MADNTIESRRLDAQETARVLEAAGYLVDGLPAPGLLTAAQLADDASSLDRLVRYEPVIDPRRIGATAVYEIGGAPCIYFTSLADSNPSPVVLAKLHRLAWNHGLAPVLWIQTPTKVLLYDSFARPTDTSDGAPADHVLAIFRTTAEGLAELARVAGRFQFESGAFWSSSAGAQVSRAGRVDSSLLRDLEGAEQRLVQDAGATRAVAHTLLMRTIFLAYLVQRGVLSAAYLRKQFRDDDLASLFANVEIASQVFAWMKRTFDGDLLTDEREENTLSAAQVAILGELLAATDQYTGQISLFPYDFSVIPVELISSIYERFAHSGDELQARGRSVHYTPLNIVDLVLSEAMQDLSGHETILDMSCGSGAFLVEALRRLVALRVAGGARRTRQLIRATLRDQIFGVDISSTAISIAAFSLYLAALELDPDPQPPEALRFEALIGRNLHIADAFDEDADFLKQTSFKERRIDLLIGNPPWTRGRLAQSAIDYCKLRGLPVMRGSVDQAFLWRAFDFCNDKTRMGLVLSAKPFFSTSLQAHDARAALLSKLTARTLIDLSELRKKGLFPTATAPAVILIGEMRAPTKTDRLTFVHVEDSGDFQRLGVLEINPDQVRTLPALAVLNEPDLMKVAAWATPRDFALVQRLRRTHPALDVWIQSRGWNSGQGYQVAGGREATPTTHTRLPVLHPNRMVPFGIAPSALGRPVPSHMHRPRELSIYEAPVLLVSRGIGRHGFMSALSDQSLLYPEVYFGISAPRTDRIVLRMLNAILNSSLATYFLFLTSSGWGVERDEVKPVDLRRMPIPRGPKAAEIEKRRVLVELLQAEQALRSAVERNELSEITERDRQRLDESVFAFYGLRSDEIALVRDFSTITLDRRARGPHSRAMRPVTVPVLAEYVTQVIQSLNAYLSVLGQRTVQGQVLVASGAPLAVVMFEIVERAADRAYLEVPRTSDAGDELRSVLRSIDERLGFAVTRTVSARRALRIYTGNVIYIVKPVAQRHWTRTAALSDADTILAESVNTAQGEQDSGATLLPSKDPGGEPARDHASKVQAY